MLLDRQIVEEPRFVGKEGQTLLGILRVPRQVASANADRAARWRNDAGEAAQGGCFTRAVGADKSEHFAGLHGKGQFPHGDEGIVELGQTVDFDHGKEAAG